MRVSAKVDYALRAMVQLAAEPGGKPLKAERLATQQDIPLRFLLGILAELRRARLVTGHRGTEGGYVLSRPPAQISLAEVMRVVDGPLVNLRDTRVAQLGYGGASEPLEDVWMAVRASLRSVLEEVSLADVADGSLPDEVRHLAAAYRASGSDDLPVAVASRRHEREAPSGR